jgi:CheY-like chemotaxis protein
MNQRLIRHLLKSRGYNFDLVFNGVQAIESLKKQSYDMVLMDIQMPEMDGYSATRQIREELKLTIPVIAMTAHAMSGEKEKCIKSGMNDYISKPINEEILFDIIQKYSSPGSFYGNESQSENNGGKIIGIVGSDNNAKAV